MSGREQFFQALGELAKVCNANLGTFVLSVYDRALSQYGYERLLDVLGKILIERGSRDPFPSVSEIRDALGVSELAEGAKAADIANRIWNAIVDHGYVATNEKLAPIIGEIGLQIAKTHGGWARLCGETDHLKDPSFFRTQLAKEVAVYQEKIRKGCLDLPPSFDEASRNLPGNKKTLEALDIAMGRKTDGQKQIKGETETDA